MQGEGKGVAKVGLAWETPAPPGYVAQSPSCRGPLRMEGNERKVSEGK